jgi:hypothetical protein
MRVTLEELSQMAAEIACPIAYLLFLGQNGPYEAKWGPILMRPASLSATWHRMARRQGDYDSLSTKRAAGSFPSEWQKLRNLTRLMMSDNPLNTALPSALPPSLQTLVLQRCRLQGEVTTHQHRPVQTGPLHDARRGPLNRLCSQPAGPKCKPDGQAAVWSQPFSTKCAAGGFPTSWQKLLNLTTLNMSGNQLDLALSSALPPRLQTLDLQYCGLKGGVAMHQHCPARPASLCSQLQAHHGPGIWQTWIACASGGTHTTCQPDPTAMLAARAECGEE